MLKPVTFYSEGVKLAGDLFLPADIKPGERRAGIVLCHGYTGVRSIYLPDNARPRRGRLRCADLRLQGLGRQRRGENSSGAL
jgi:hypothetical protein